MIRNAVIHLANEQPLVCDLFEMPSTADVTLRCTNLRTLAGKRPIFADHSESTFLFPYLHIRFLEIPPGAEGRPGLPAGETAAAAGSGAPEEPEPEPDLEIDEDFLRRIREA